jgi:tetratricopeptide (TPR) repeat protein
MNQVQTLQSQAIGAAEKQEWKVALGANTEILLLEPANVSALNRLGFCYLQLGDKKNAKKTYQQVLDHDPYNAIAKKYLAVLENGKDVILSTSTSFQENFIEEPGKTKTIALCRLADQSILTMVTVATLCKLVIKQYRISVETEQGVYLGSLPDDLSHSLTKLINGGNEYKTVVKSATKSSCIVFIKELSRSKKQEHLNSFPSTTSTRTSGLHEELLVDNTPVDVTETGGERESFEDYQEDFNDEAA